ncbi:MAG: VacJ family lipoprotein [Gammaproteobacteria bacterium]
MSFKTSALFIYLLLIALLTGCASTAKNLDDPWESWNRNAQEFNDDFDDQILKPLAKGYLFTMPEPVNNGVSNFFSNIDDIGVFINDFLQFKVSQGGMDISRFILNSTVGIAGFIDVATMLDLPKHNEDFAQTLAVWGVPSGPYLVVPFWGPSSARGATGLIGDGLMDPLNYAFLLGFTASVIGTVAQGVDTTDRRAGFMTTEKFVDEAAINRYDFIKSSYLQYRDYLINDGKIPEDVSFDPYMDFEDDAQFKLDLVAPPQE